MSMKKIRKSKDEKDPKTKLLMGFFESLGAKFVDVTPKRKGRI